jgi:predicted dehydrogenase
MYAEVSAEVHVYAPVGQDLVDHLGRIVRFNLRPENPTCWEVEVHAGPDSLERLVRERPGNVVVLSGRNRGKIDYLLAAIGAGLNVLADKPWIIETADFHKLEAALNAAEARGLVAYDIMTERYEITSILQRELVRDPEILGAPAEVFMESVHHLAKTVAGVPLLRPAWFFDIHQQGEGLTDVGTHLVDLVAWTLFPDQPIEYRSDIQVTAARRWPTQLSAEDFLRVTGQHGPPLDYYCNTEVSYRLRGIPVRLNVLWNFEAPPGAGDTHLAVYRGSRSSIEVRQGPEQNYRPELYVIGDARPAARRRVEALAARFPGVGIEETAERAWITIPARYRVGHEAHFAQVTRQFLKFVKNPAALPAWEKANMLAKYYVTTRGVELARA